ncbi:Glycerophosphodiester phosphodiesterase GDPD1, chloroplastic [Cucumispora dikerogammari]|nr:Glycerophosphodiester phosphodiesterase GDPD1, chloroplastic [Cucumispora dikerogammari]
MHTADCRDPNPNIIEVPSQNNIYPQKIGHRGFGPSTKSTNIADQFYIENTIYAFEVARSNNISCVEFDVHPTSDNCLVIFHDFYINNRFIGDLTREQFKNEGRIYYERLKPRIDNNKKIYKEKISESHSEQKSSIDNIIIDVNICYPPTLNEVLTYYKDTNFIFNIEIKYPEVCANNKCLTRNNLLKLIEEETRGFEKQILFFSSFDRELVLLFSKLLKTHPAYLIVKEGQIDEVFKFVNRCHAVCDNGSNYCLEACALGLVFEDAFGYKNKLYIKEHRKKLKYQLGIYQTNKLNLSKNESDLFYIECKINFIIVD